MSQEARGAVGVKDAKDMTDEEMREALRAFVLASFLPGEAPETLLGSTRLISSGIVASLSLLELVNFVEGAFAVALAPADIGVARMDSVDAIVALVRERSARA